MHPLLIEAMYPLLREGSRLAAPALLGAAKSIPAAHLARMGLLRGPLVGLGPTVGAFLAGGAAVALMVPGSRAWLREQANRALQHAKQWSAKAGEELHRVTGESDGRNQAAEESGGRSQATESN
jgi:hypothetical protein